MPIDIKVSRGVACDGLLFACGQCDLDAEGRPQRPGDLAAQTKVALAHLLDVLKQGGRAPRDLAHLHVFYRSDGTIDERAYEAQIASELPLEARPVTVLTPVPAFFYPGVEVEIDAVACAGQDPQSLKPNTGAFPPATRRDGLIFVRGGAEAASSDLAAGARAAADSLKGNLEALGAGPEDLCKLTVYLPVETSEPERAAARRALHTVLPQPATTCVVLPNLGRNGNAIRLEGLAADRTSAAWQPRAVGDGELQAVRCGRLLFIGGLPALDHKNRVLRPHDLSAQTHLAMESLGQHLAAFGTDFEHLVKVNTYYRSPGGAEALHQNLSIRSSYYASPGPASTGMPVPVLDPPGAMISIDAIAMIEPDGI